METSGTHETLTARDEVKAGSERSFGMVFAAVFALVGVWPLLDDNPVRPWALAVAAGFALFALVAPRCLRPLNRAWFRFGMVLHRIVSPLVMGMLFFVTITPIGLVMRLLGKDVLALKWDPQASSYWIERTPPGPAPEGMKNQF